MKIKSFYEYENLARNFALYPEAGTGSPMALAYTALGLTGEAGEASEKVKKLIRDGEFDKSLTLKELGDVLWYLTAMTREMGYELSDVAEVNIVKLLDRQERGQLQGSGDTR
jgi:NTP pyrophosphatase (non-canonical NTP hydrolase)